jgi:hypothetical protein
MRNETRNHDLLMKLTRDILKDKGERLREEQTQCFNCYRVCSQQQFRGDFFQRPRNYLRSTALSERTAVYLIKKFPDIGVNFECFSRYLHLNSEEITLLQEQFWPLTFTVQDQNCHYRIRHIFCKDIIDEALDGVRHLCCPFTEICGRRIYLGTRGLAAQLNEMHQALEHQPNYQICFVPREWFDQLRMELVVWKREVAIVWTVGKQSIACREYPSVAILHEFCTTLWNDIPPAQRSRRAAKKQLELWVKRAERLGLIP